MSRAIGGQLVRLAVVAGHTASAGHPTDGVAAEVQSIAAVVDPFVAATRKRV